MTSALPVDGDCGVLKLCRSALTDLYALDVLQADSGIQGVEIARQTVRIGYDRSADKLTTTPLVGDPVAA